MKDFLLENYVLIVRASELMAIFAGLIFYRKYKKTNAIYFIYFLFSALIIELLGSYPRYFNNYSSLSYFKKIIEGTVFEKNYWWFQLTWSIGATLFFSYYYYKVSQKRVLKKTIKIIGLLFFVVSSVYFVVNWSSYKSAAYFPFIDLVSLIAILFLVFSYFIELLSSENVLDFYRSINFYISTGILVFWLIMTPMTFYEVYFSEADWDFIVLRWQIYLFAIVFMYLTFTIGLMVSKPETEIGKL